MERLTLQIEIADKAKCSHFWDNMGNRPMGIEKDGYTVVYMGWGFAVTEAEYINEKVSSFLSYFGRKDILEQEDPDGLRFSGMDDIEILGELHEQWTKEAREQFGPESESSKQLELDAEGSTVQLSSGDPILQSGNETHDDHRDFQNQAGDVCESARVIPRGTEESPSS